MDEPERPRRTVRSRDAERTRARLLSVATQEFAQHGYDGARVERIVGAADVTTRMLYHYFGSKEKLYVAVLDAVYEDIRQGERALALHEGDPVAALRRLVEYTFDFMRDRPLFVELMRGENMLGGRHVRRSERVREMSLPLLEAIGRLMDRGCAAGRFRVRVDPLQLYVSIVALSTHHLNAVHTLSATFGCDLADPGWLAARRAHAVETVLRCAGAETRPAAGLAAAELSAIRPECDEARTKSA